MHAIIIILIAFGLIMMHLQDVYPMHIRKKNKYKEPKNH